MIIEARRMIRQKMLNLTKFVVLLFIMSGCGYKNNFSCNPSRGAYCTSMSKVDSMITNGTIDFLDIDQKKQKRFRLGHAK